MNKTTKALSRLGIAVKRLQSDQGRIARTNARRSVLGALKGVRNALDKDFPSIQKPSKAKKPKVPHWREYEKRMRVPDVWMSAKAEMFHKFFCLNDSISLKPVEWFGRGSKLFGEHCTGKIRIRLGMRPVETWRTFLHELAHYRVKHHNKAFTVELMRIYKLFTAWSKNEGDNIAKEGLDQPMKVSIREISHGSEI